MGSSPPLVTFFASLAPGVCLKHDAEGGAKLILDIPDTDAPAVAKALPVLRDCVFAVVLKPVKHG
jgi:hypothetical protein